MAMTASAADSPVAATTPIPATTENSSVSNIAAKRPKRPDQEAHQAALKEIEAQISKLTKEQNALREKLSKTDGKGGPQEKRRKEIISRLSEIRKERGKSTKEQDKVLDQEGTLKNSLQRKINDLKANQKRIPYKSVADIDSKLKQNEDKIQSGALSILDEKRLIDENVKLRRSRKLVSEFDSQQKSIESDKSKLDELQSKLHNPALDALNDEHDKLEKELEKIKGSMDDKWKQRSLLLDERTRIQNALDEAWEKKRKFLDDFRKNNNEFFKWQQEDRKRRQLEEKRKRIEEQKQMLMNHAKEQREVAEVPAFSAEINVCDILLQYLHQNAPTATPSSTGSKSTIGNNNNNGKSPNLANIEVPEGMVLAKSNDPNDGMYFPPTATKKKNQRKKQRGDGKGWNPKKIPLSIIERFFEIKVTPPSQESDIEKTIEDINDRKKYYLDNQKSVTEMNKKKADEVIAKLEKQLESVTITE
ncbi:multicopy suppressor of BFA (Brefeldin A) [Mycoemilia scoparia]|uniref:Multicopy suppressor of BFA (Brefeldin A) n=1 Tax=Mycoemilia scoparia TaxID=417184 RepID=A0A9W8DUI6_9FUNG|nr:multicopy suppressor of BFA (Brefeldin A) [Mycoemilia scoparia]